MKVLNDHPWSKMMGISAKYGALAGAVSFGGYLGYRYIKKILDKQVKIMLHGESGSGRSTIASSLVEGVIDEYKEAKLQEGMELNGTIVDVGSDKQRNEKERNIFFENEENGVIKIFLYVFDSTQFTINKKIQYGLKLYRNICQQKNIAFFGIGTKGSEISGILKEYIIQNGMDIIVVDDARKKYELLTIFDEKIIKMLNVRR